VPLEGVWWVIGLKLLIPSVQKQNYSCMNLNLQFSEKIMLFTETQLKGAFIIDLEKDQTLEAFFCSYFLCAGI